MKNMKATNQQQIGGRLLSFDFCKRIRVPDVAVVAGLGHVESRKPISPPSFEKRMAPV